MKVYLVYAHNEFDNGNHYVEKVFSTEELAELYMKRENKKAGWCRIQCVDEQVVLDK